MPEVFIKTQHITTAKLEDVKLHVFALHALSQYHGMCLFSTFDFFDLFSSLVV